jgi:hypothetical protein
MPILEFYSVACVARNDFMAISVVCSGCKSRFSVSDQFAGRTGPCPKCKKPITIPKKSAAAVTIHEPEAPASKGAIGRMPTAPIVFHEKPLSIVNVMAVFAGIAGSLLAAAICRATWGPGNTPSVLLAVGAVILAFPTAWIGYWILRNREIEPFASTSLITRCAICAVVYSSLWGIHAFLPIEQMHEEFWRWLFVGPIFGFAGALAAFASLDFDWGTSVAHFALYVLFTTTLRWILGLPSF